MTEKKILYADLTKNSLSVKVEKIEAIGGAALASRLLKQDSLIFATGVFSGTLIPAGSVVGVFSPNGEHYFPGNFGTQMRLAGLDAIVISGRAERPVALWIDDDGIDIERADKLWGLDCYETVERILKDANDPTIGVAVIGPAGEEQVKFASIYCDDQLDISGLGYAMGAKLLKAVIVRGSNDVKVAHGDDLIKAISKKEVPSKIRKDLIAKKLPKNSSCLQCNIACREVFKANGSITAIFPEEAEAFNGYKAEEVIEAIALCKRLGLNPIYTGALARAVKAEKLSEFIKSLAVKSEAEKAIKAVNIKIEKPLPGKLDKLFNSLMICKRAPYDGDELAKLYKFVTGETMPREG
ncbi:MAG: aldehyde ferredoxin oxidoreductase N-terminal domain-containing protein [Methanocellales archaeon]